ncbi:MAG: PspA-associated protein PspAA [Streptosporangiaceae bacterium]
MIVRILGEGQFELEDSAAAELNVLDTALETAVEQGDESGFRSALDALLGRIRAVGSPVQADVLEPSGLILPRADASMAEVRKLLTDGLIPG